MGRYSSHQARDAARQRERVAREEEQIERREAEKNLKLKLKFIVRFFSSMNLCCYAIFFF
jgi:hypothetical protein